MNRFFVFALTLLLCTAFLLGGCGNNAAKETASSAIETVAQTDSGYDETSPKSAQWFDNAVFVGDSVTLKLDYYCEEHPEALGKASFYCAGSLGYNNALWAIDNEKAVHPYYQGETHLTEDCAAVTGKNNVFIMLGMNDIGLYGPQGAMEACQTVVDNLLKKSPDARLYLQSVTPMIDSVQIKSFNNELIREFNGLLKSYCDKKGYKYLDVYSAFADENGNLPDKLCSDPDNMGLHFNDTSCQMWVDFLKNNA